MRCIAGSQQLLAALAVEGSERQPPPGVDTIDALASTIESEFNAQSRDMFSKPVNSFLGCYRRPELVVASASRTRVE